MLNLLLAAILTLPVSIPTPPVDATAPNVVFIVSDDQRFDTIAALGNPHIATPRLDELVAEGTAFVNAYCMGSRNGAVCLPSRCMMMTSRSLFACDNWARARKETTFPLVPELFRDAGYATFATGKWHCGQEWFTRCFESGRSVLFGGMGSHTTLKVFDVDGETRGPGHSLLTYSSAEFATRAVEWINSQDGTRPFFCHLSFTAPHDPRTRPVETEGDYPPATLPLPANYLPEHPFDNGEMRIRDEKLLGWPRTREAIRGELSHYYAMITHLDAQVGRVLDALERKGFRERTIIVFCSDHGLAIGSHGLLGKQNLYEHSMRAPVVVSGPGVPAGAIRTELVYLHDLGPTMTALADVTGPAGADGRPLLGPGASEIPPRTGVLTAYKDFQRAWRDERWKLIHYPRIERYQLFDLDADPDEVNDLAGDPAHADRLAAMQAALEEARVAAGDR